MEFSLVVRGFRRNVSLVEAHADGMSHDASLTQTPYNVNCFNWVVGHVITSRNALFRNLAGEELWSTDDGLERYRRESEPIIEDGPGVWRLADLITALRESQQRLEQDLGDVSTEYLAEEIEVDGRAATREARILFAYFHDTYHTGQLDLLRQMSGKTDKII